MPDQEPASAKDLVQELKNRGMSNKEIAGEIRRDPKMVWKILNDKTSGAAYTQTLGELVRDGRATTRPERRKGKDGHIVPVRAKAGAETKTVIPEETGGKYVPQPKRGQFSTSTTYFPQGGRQHEIKLPKTKTAIGRAKGQEELIAKIKSAAKGQKAQDKRMNFTLTFSNGRVMDVGSKAGYYASDVLYNVRKHGQDALGWLGTQASDRYDNLDLTKVNVTGVTMTIYDAPGLAREANPYKKTNIGKRDTARNRILRTGKKRPPFNPKRDLL